MSRQPTVAHFSASVVVGGGGWVSGTSQTQEEGPRAGGRHKQSRTLRPKLGEPSKSVTKLGILKYKMKCKIKGILFFFCFFIYLPNFG